MSSGEGGTAGGIQGHGRVTGEGNDGAASLRSAPLSREDVMRIVYGVAGDDTNEWIAARAHSYRMVD